MEGKSRGSVLSISYFSSLSVWGGIDILSELMGFETKGGDGSFCGQTGEGSRFKKLLRCTRKGERTIKKAFGFGGGGNSPPFDPKTRTKRELAFLLSHQHEQLFFYFRSPHFGENCMLSLPFGFPLNFMGFNFWATESRILLQFPLSPYHR